MSLKTHWKIKYKRGPLACDCRPTPGHGATGPLQQRQTPAHTGGDHLSFLPQHLVCLLRPHRPRTQDTGPRPPREGRAHGGPGKLLLRPVAAWVPGRRPRLGAGVPNITQGSACLTGTSASSQACRAARARSQAPPGEGQEHDGEARPPVLTSPTALSRHGGSLWLPVSTCWRVPVPRPPPGSHTHSTSCNRSPRSQTRRQSPPC